MAPVVPHSSYGRLLASGKVRVDPLTAGVRAAGHSNVVSSDSTKQNLQSEIYFPAEPTPRPVAKYRKDLVPGNRWKHPGAFEDPVPGARGEYFGIKTCKGESVDRTLQAQHREGHALYLEEQKNRVYLTTKREPLGQSYLRGHVLPSCTSEPTFKFGKALHKDYVSAKEVVFGGKVEEGAGVHGRWKLMIIYSEFR
jgi:hypothetical protein